MVAAREGAARRELARQEPVGEHRTREHPGLVARQIGRQIVQIAREEEVVRELDHLRALADRGARHRAVAGADSPRFDGAARLQLVERGRRIAARDRGQGGIVQENDVDLVSSQPLLGARDGLVQVVALESLVRLLVPGRGPMKHRGAERAHLGDDAHGFAGEPLAEARLHRAATVDIRRFEGGDPELERPIDDAIALASRRPVHKPRRRDPRFRASARKSDAGFAETTCPHVRRL